MKQRRAVVRWSLVLGLLVFLASPALAASHRFYLSLGTSLAAGVEPDRAGNDAPTNEGYADQLHQLLKARDRKLQLVKLGCPGETTATMISGGICPYDAGSQLDQAVAFLQANRGAVSLVTIDMGANDVLGCVIDLGDADCIARAFTNVATNLPFILDALRKAGPGVPIVAMNYYNPFVAAWPQGLAFQSNALLNGFNDGSKDIPGLNDLLESIYGSFQVPVGDVARAFYSTDFTIFPRIGRPANVLLVCQLTWMCTASDIHPNRTGYFVIALVLASAMK